MKKYLITAMAVAVSGILISCHEDELSGSIVEMKKEAFEETFVKAFGQPDPNHTWGFRTSDATALTRDGNNPNGNQWDECPGVTTKERSDVFAYVNTLSTGSKSIPSDISTYYVTHIYQGTGTHGSYNYSNALMNQLEIATSAPASISWDGQKQGTWLHVYDFNAAISTDFEGNMLIEDTPPLNFAYLNSADSKWHDKWIGVDGANVPGGDYSDYYYICFDFEAMPNDYYTIFEMPEYNNAKANVPGDWRGKTGADLIAAGITTVTSPEKGEVTVQSNWKAVQLMNENMYAPGDNNYTDWIIRITKATSSGGGGSTTTGPQVYQMSETSYNNGSVKRQVITGERVVESGRVFCEDLGSSSLNDIDYNDIVFDAVIVNEYEKLVTTYYDANGDEERTETSYSFDAVDGHTGYDRHYALIRLMAAGGTIPAAVKGYEVHDELGSNGTTVMINTLDEDSRTVVGMAAVATATPSDLKDVDTQSTKFYGINNINDITIDVRYSQVSEKLTAKHGAVPSKILVPLGTRWPRERQNIGEAYPEFGDYVKNADHDFWTGEKVESKLYDNLQGLTAQEGEMITEEETVYEHTDNNSGTQKTKTLVAATNSTLLTPATGETILYNYTTAGPGYLYGETDGDNSVGRVTVPSTGVTAGSTVRVYGVSIAGWELSSNFATMETSYTADGYVDFVIDQQTATRINGDLSFTGKHFTITYVTVIAGSGNSGSGGGASLTNNMISSPLELTGGVVGFYSDQTQAQQLASNLVVGTSVFAIQLQLTNDSWYFQMGTGTTGNNLCSGYSNTAAGYSDYKNGNIFIIRVTLTKGMLDLIKSNVNNTGWWSQAMFAFQGSGCKVIGFAIE